MNRTQYFDVLRKQPKLSNPNDFVVGTMCHSVYAPNALKGILAPAFSAASESPRLLSRVKVAAITGGPVKPPQPHEPSMDVDVVFCYLAPRQKLSRQHSQGIAILVFAEDGASSGRTWVRPFDSGGLKYSLGHSANHCPKMTDPQISALIEVLTLDGSWLSEFGIFGSRLFNASSEYLLGSRPSGTDPLGLAKDDSCNFTWEVLHEHELLFEDRLVGLLDVRFVDINDTLPGNPRLLNSDEVDLFRSRKMNDRIELREHTFDLADYKSSVTALQQDLYEFCEACGGRPGW